MKKIIIALSFFGLFGTFTFAQNDLITNTLQDITQSPIGDIPSAVLNDTDLMSLEIGTSETLNKTVDEIIKNSSNFSSFDWCRDASSFVGDMPLNLKQSLAWNKDSYRAVVDFTPEDEQLATNYKKLLGSYDDLNKSFDDMQAGLLADQAASRFIAIARSSVIEALNEFKSENPDQNKINSLSEISKKSIECASPENSDLATERLSALFGTSFSSSSEDAIQTESYKTTKITRSDISIENTSVESGSVNDIDSFKNFVLSQMSKNENILSVEDHEDSILIRYQVPVKFLGFIKSKTSAKIRINDNFDVKVGYNLFGGLSSKVLKIDNTQIKSILLETYSPTDTTEKIGFLKSNFSLKAKATESVFGLIKSTEDLSASMLDKTPVSDEMEVSKEINADQSVAVETLVQ